MAYNLGGVNPYSSGAVPINNDRYMDYFLKQQAHQQALQQAYNAHVGEQAGKLSSAGMNTNESKDDKGVVYSDVKTLADNKNNWYNFVTDPKNARILSHANNPQHGMVYSQAQQLYDKALNGINTSKENMANIPKVAELAMKDTGTDHSEDVRRASLPYSHPDFKKVDYSSFVNPPPFDVVADRNKTRNLPEFKENEKGTQYGTTDMNAKDINKTVVDNNKLLADGVTINPNFGKQIPNPNYGKQNPNYLMRTKTTILGHNDDQIKLIAKDGESQYSSDPKFKNFINNTLAKKITEDPELYKHYDDVLFKYTGQRMDLDPTHLNGTNGHKDLARAFKLDNTVLSDRTKVESEIDKVAKDEFDRKANLQKQKDFRDYEVKHPIPTSAGTDTYDYLDKATKLLKTGNSDLINAHLAQWKAGAKTDPNGKKIGFDNAEPMSDGKIAIHYTIPFHIEHVGNVAREQTDILDPNDPQILPKMAALHQQFLGRDAKVEKALQKKPDNPAPSAPKPTGNQHQFLKQRGDGITINRKVKNDNWSISKTIQGASHDDGGVADDIQGKPINVEGGELKITNGDGHDAIIPKKWVQRVKSFLKIGDNKAVTKIVESLPKDPSIAEDGGD